MWLGIPTKYGRHVIPHNDLIEHENSKNCICGPTFDSFIDEKRTVAWVYIHASLDRREDRAS